MMTPVLTPRSSDPVWSQSTPNNRRSFARDRKRRSSQLRIVARIRPLTKDEADCQVSIHPTIVEKENGSTPQRILGNRSGSGNTTPTPFSPQMRVTSPTPSLLSPYQYGRKDSVDASPSTWSRKGEEKNYPTSLIATTENRSRFDFDAVIGEQSTQRETYERAIGDTVRRNISRQVTTTIIAIGQSRSGKRFTMNGGFETGEKSLPTCESGSILGGVVPEGDGIIPRSVQDMFKAKQRHAATKEGFIAMCLVEFSGESWEDLLVGYDQSPEQSKFQAFDPSRGWNVWWLEVTSPAMAKQVLHEVSVRPPGRTGSKHSLCSFRVLEPQRGTSTRMQNPNTHNVITEVNLVSLSAPEVRSGMNSTVNADLWISRESRSLVDILCAYSGCRTISDSSQRNSDTVTAKTIQGVLAENCFAIIVACVSPADSKIESTMEILRLTQTAKRVSVINGPSGDNQGPATPGEGSAAIMAENVRLKEKIRVLNERRSRSDDDTANIVKKTDLTSLQLKVKKAEEAARNARESSRSLAAAADRWRSHRRRSQSKQTANEYVSELVPAGGEVRNSIRPTHPTESEQEKANPKAEMDALLAKLQALETQLEQEKQNREHLLDQNGALKVKLGVMETEKAQESAKVDHLKSDLEETVQALTKQKLAAAALERSCGSFKELTDEQEREISTLRGKVTELTTANKSLEGKVNDMEFAFDGERRLRQQAQDLHQVVERNYQSLSAELNDVKLKLASQVSETERLRTSHLLVEYLSASGPTARNALLASSEEMVSAVHGAGLSSASIYYDAKDVVSDDAGSCARPEQTSMNKKKRGYEQKDVGTKSVNGTDEDEAAYCQCQCSTKFSPESARYVDFYLPKLNVSCKCGEQQQNISQVEDADILHLRNVLRPWQVAFLESVGISRIPELIASYDTTRDSLAKLMRRWRKERNLPSMKTRLCSSALMIWSRTCKAVVRSYVAQLACGVAEPRLPDFLDVSTNQIGLLGTSAEETSTV